VKSFFKYWHCVFFTFASFTIILAQENLLQNPEFDAGMESWIPVQIEPSVSLFEVDDSSVLSGENSLQVYVVDGGPLEYSVQVYQSVPIQDDHTYSITFLAYYEADDELQIKIDWEEDGGNWTRYFFKGITLNEETERYGPYTFTSRYEDSDANFKLFLGQLMDTVVYLDSIVINDITNTNVASYPVTLPDRYQLAQNYPNPFNPTTVIPYTLSKSGQVTLDILNIRGKRICSLVHGVQTAGNYQIHWNSSDDTGNRVTNGIYFYTLSVSGTHGFFKKTHKMVLMK